MSITLALASGCSRENNKVAQAPQAQPVPVQVAVAKEAVLPTRIESIGTAQPLRFVAIRSQVDGLVSKIHVAEGAEVAAGDLLVTIDPRPFINAVQAADAELALARAEAERAASDATRYEQLNAAAAISQEQFQQLRTRAITAAATAKAKEAALANAKLQLERSEIRAPIAGRTGTRGLHEGALVRSADSGQALLSINQLDPITVVFSIPESQLATIRLAGENNTLSISATPRGATQSISDGKLHLIDNAVDATTGTVLLKAIFPNATHTLWPGQFAAVTLEIRENSASVVVPSVAVKAGQEGSQVFVVKADASIDLRRVKTGRTVDGLTVIESGVSAGETVVTDGQLRLTRTSKVVAKSLEAAAKPAAPKP